MRPRPIPIIGDSDQGLTFKRIGRLMGVWPKQPFALSSEYSPKRQNNWAKSRRTWKIHDRVTNNIIEENKTQSDLLVYIASEWARPVEYLHEYNIFLSLCKKLIPVVCESSKALDQLDRVASELRKQGHDTLPWTPRTVLTAASIGAATYLVEVIPLLHIEQRPIVVSCTILLLLFGQKKLCELMRAFESSDDKTKDKFAGRDFPRCGSTETRDGTPCQNTVCDDEFRCWIHGGGFRSKMETIPHDVQQ